MAQGQTFEVATKTTGEDIFGNVTNTTTSTTYEIFKGKYIVKKSDSITTSQDILGSDNSTHAVTEYTYQDVAWAGVSRHVLKTATTNISQSGIDIFGGEWHTVPGQEAVITQDYTLDGAWVRPVTDQNRSMPDRRVLRYTINGRDAMAQGQTFEVATKTTGEDIFGNKTGTETTTTYLIYQGKYTVSHVHSVTTGQDVFGSDNQTITDTDYEQGHVEWNGVDRLVITKVTTTTSQSGHDMFGGSWSNEGYTIVQRYYWDDAKKAYVYKYEYTGPDGVLQIADPFDAAARLIITTTGTGTDAFGSKSDTITVTTFEIIRGKLVTKQTEVTTKGSDLSGVDSEFTSKSTTVNNYEWVEVDGKRYYLLKDSLVTTITVSTDLFDNISVSISKIRNVNDWKTVNGKAVWGLVDVIEEPIDLTEGSEDWNFVLAQFVDEHAFNMSAEDAITTLNNLISTFNKAFGLDAGNRIFKGSVSFSKDLWGNFQMSWTQNVYIKDDIINKNRAFVDYAVTVTAGMDEFGGTSRSLSVVNYSYGDDGKGHYVMLGADNNADIEPGALSSDMMKAIASFEGIGRGNIIKKANGGYLIKANISEDTIIVGLSVVTIATSTYKIINGRAMVDTATAFTYYSNISGDAYAEKSVTTYIRDDKGRLIETVTVNSEIIDGTENIDGRVRRVYIRDANGRMVKNGYVDIYEEWIPGMNGEPGKFVEIGEIPANILRAAIGEELSEIQKILEDINDAIKPFAYISLDNIHSLEGIANAPANLGQPVMNAGQVTGNIQDFFNEFFAKATDDEKRDFLKSKFGEILGTALFNVYKTGRLTVESVRKVIDWIKGLNGSVVNCAVNSLVSLMTRLNINAEREEIAENAIIVDILTGVLNESNARGSTLELSIYSLKVTAATKGLTLYGVTGSLDELAGAGPFIAHMDMNGDGTAEHFVIVTSITDTSVTYIDNGREVTVTRSEFSSKWKGNALAARNTTNNPELSDNAMRSLRGASTNYTVPPGWGLSAPTVTFNSSTDTRITL
ncbi:MAG: cysteine peptidase family C39 domain-containing protein, partial [Candidatus Omnitrophota bacterium]